MTKQVPELLEYFVHDILNDERISFRRMMSGYSIYLDGQVFAIYVFDIIWFRQNKNNKKLLDEHNCKQFQYERKDGKVIKMRYRQLPEEVMENQEELWKWVVLSSKQIK